MNADVLRREPVQPPRWHEDERAWFITCYSDVASFLKSEHVKLVDTAKFQALSERMNGAFSNTILLLSTSYPLQNPPAHGPVRAWLRDLLSASLRRWTAEKIDDLVVRLLGPVDGFECLDAIQRLARPLPATIVGDMIGLDLADVYLTGELGLDIVSLWSRATVPLRDLSEMEKSATSIVERLTARWGSVRRPEFAGLSFLTLAGVLTSGGLIGSTIHMLAGSLPLQDRLRSEPALVSGFVNETLRCYPPARRFLGYRTQRDLTLSSVTIPAESAVIVDVESAHRDPEAYPDPDCFDPAREGPPSFAFGAGAHACVGAVLARLEAKVLIEHLLRNYIIFPAGEARLRPSRDWYEFEYLPIRLYKI